MSAIEGDPLGVYCITCSAAAGTPCDDLGGALPLGPEGFHRSRLILGPSGCPHGTVETATTKCRDCIRERASQP